MKYKIIKTISRYFTNLKLEIILFYWSIILPILNIFGKKQTYLPVKQENLT